MTPLKDEWGGFEYSREKMQKNQELHHHGTIEIIKTRDIPIRLRVKNASEVYDVFDGDIAVVKSGDIHKITSSNAVIESIHIPVSYQNLSDGLFIRESFVIPKEAICENSIFEQLLSNIISLLSQNEQGAKKSLCACLCSLLVSLYPKRRTVVSFGNDDTKPIGVSNISIETVGKFEDILAYINQNFKDSSINLGTLSERFSMNKTFLSALFPKLTSTNFKHYIHSLRINYAIELMTSTGKSISEIAYECGFETIRSFNNVFSSLSGTTPSGFIKSLKADGGGEIDTEINCIEKPVSDCKWTSNVSFKINGGENSIEITCNDSKVKLWCHLRHRMLFFAGKTYSISYLAKALENAVGSNAAQSKILCDFYFDDKTTNNPHHTPKISNITQDDGWTQYFCVYTVPSHYVPSFNDTFSVYSVPYENYGTSFIVKDIKVSIQD